MSKTKLIQLWVLLAAAGISLAAVCGCNSNRSTSEQSDSQDTGRELDTIQSVVSSEELLLELTPKLKWLSSGIMNRCFPDERGRKLFADQVVLFGIEAPEQASQLISNLPAVTDQTWRVASSPQTHARDKLTIWSEVIDDVDYFENAKVYLIDGHFAEGSTNQFESHMGYAALARLKNGSLRSFSAKLIVNWEKEPNGPQASFNDWQIVRWQPVSFHATDAPISLFVDAIHRAIPDPDMREQATRSLHHEFFVENYFKVANGDAYTIEEDHAYPLFFPDVTFEHPGVSIVDIDRDGWDDLYVCAMRGRNLLFRNRGDGTFDEIAESVGLAVQGGSTSAAFADFDNDGDSDLILGRGRDRAMYFVNVDGKFVDHTQARVGIELPYLVSSIAVADYNGDGLLDVYLGTYCPIEGGQGTAQSQNPRWVDVFLNEQQQVEIKEHLKQAHSVLNMVGPPNLLLVNVGDGKFDVSPFNDQLESWKRCFQVAWSDYDQDGDPDVYLSNDYANDQLFRNDGEQGFVDVTKALKLDKLGFGMGISWGDYDNDGHMDLYASNMFSKAGSRITAQIPGLDSRFKAMAYGNYLYRFDGDTYELMSGYPDEPLAVSKAGWSWGGQFTDFNNDSFQDLYVASGYNTVPPEFAVDMDL